MTAVNTSQHIREETDELVDLQESLRPVNFVNLFLTLIRKSRKLIKRGDVKVYRVTPAKQSEDDARIVLTSSSRRNSANSVTPPRDSFSNFGIADNVKNARLNNGESKSERSTGTGVSPPGRKSTALNPVSHEVAEDIHLILLSDLILFTRRVVKPKLSLDGQRKYVTTSPRLYPYLMLGYLR